ncbi:hypothetical protein A2U01_0004857, partial [Trifolium medium]|nr:hypothetical protein [Trifolium medium]
MINDQVSALVKVAVEVVTSNQITAFRKPKSCNHGSFVTLIIKVNVRGPPLLDILNFRDEYLVQLPHI